MPQQPIELKSNPREKDYEEFICAYFQAGGLYVEKNIIFRETEELLELDIIISNFKSDSVDKILVEIKSGHWGFSEIFKVRGWLDFLKMDSGAFIIQNRRPSISWFKENAAKLNINLVDNYDLSRTEANLSEYLLQTMTDEEIETLRFAYLIERNLQRKIKTLKRSNPLIQSYIKLDDYFFKINCGSFFTSNPVQRIKKLFDTYLQYKNITAKVCYELETGSYSDDIVELSGACYRKLFYRPKYNALQGAVYIEHLARLTILKSCVEHLILNHRSDFEKRDFISRIEYLSLPVSIQNGLKEIVKEPYFHRYPIFWQWFTYVMGGFILTDFEEEEYQYLAEKTSIPIQEIPNAFDSFNKLFPTENGWFLTLPYSNIKWHRFFPLALSGIGANHRRYIHLESENDIYEAFREKVSGRNTMLDLIKWNNLGYEILSS